MLSSERSLTIVSIICIVIIGSAIGLKVMQLSALATINKAQDLVKTSAHTVTEQLRADASFFHKPMAQAEPEPRVETPAELPVTASAYLVGNLVTGKVYLEKDANHPRPIASMSKLMTALVALETLKPDDRITITEPMTNVFPDASHIGAGETFTVRELLWPLLLNSSNVAAEALASSSDRIRFLDGMNSYAWEIGLPQSFFADPSGLSPLNAASPRGFFALAQYLYRARQDILALTRTVRTSVSTTTDHGAHDFISIHPFVTDPRFIGGKTGRTDEAGETMLTMLRIDNQPIAFIILGSAMGKRGDDTEVLVEAAEKLLQ